MFVCFFLFAQFSATIVFHFTVFIIALNIKGNGYPINNNAKKKQTQN